MPLDTANPGTCYTCKRSSFWLGQGSPPGCDALTGDEDEDAGIVDYCEASGVNDEASERRGWPLDTSFVCPSWAPRSTTTPTGA